MERCAGDGFNTHASEARRGDWPMTTSRGAATDRGPWRQPWEVEAEASVARTCSSGPRFFLPTRALPFHSLLPAHSIARKWAANFARSLRKDLNLKAGSQSQRSSDCSSFGEESSGQLERA